MVCAQADVNKDGVINYEEFVPTARRRMNLGANTTLPSALT
jgi:hypothetical protein